MQLFRHDRMWQAHDLKRVYDVVALAAQGAVEKLLNRLLVVDDEDAWGCGSHFSVGRNAIAARKVRCRP